MTTFPYHVCIPNHASPYKLAVAGGSSSSAGVLNLVVQPEACDPREYCCNLLLRDFYKVELALGERLGAADASLHDL